jgi:hypothetical protein
MDAAAPNARREAEPHQNLWLAQLDLQGDPLASDAFDRSTLDLTHALARDAELPPDRRQRFGRAGPRAETSPEHVRDSRREEPREELALPNPGLAHLQSEQNSCEGERGR